MSLKYLFDTHAAVGPDQISEVLENSDLTILSGTPRRAQRYYLDTFDWRIRNSNGVLTVLESTDGHQLTWRELPGGQIRYRHMVPGMPRFREDLPGTSMTGQLGSSIEMRAIYPRATVSCNVTHMKVIDREQKTVLQLEVQRDLSARTDNRKKRLIQSRLEILPVTGYEKTAQKVARILQRELPISRVSEVPDLVVMRELGQLPDDKTAIPVAALEADLRADVACRRILRSLFATMMLNENGIREDTDSEFLHDYRVAIRRTRSLLGQVKYIYPRKQTNYFRNKFAWLGRATNPVRDLDVYLLDIEKYRKKLPAELQDHLHPFGEFLVRHKEMEHRKLVKVMDSHLYRRLKTSWNTYLDSSVPRHTTLRNAMRPIHAVAGERIWRLYKSAIREGRAIENESPAALLHGLRKTCKKLRYLLEFFSTLYPESKTEPLITSLKALQNNLGAFHDYEVQQHSLTQFKRAMMEEMDISEKTQQAMDLLVSHLAEKQQSERRKFAKRFARFSSPGVRKEFAGLFRNLPVRNGTAG